MNRRYFLSSSLMLGGFAVLSRFALARALPLENARSSKDTQGDNGIRKVIKTDAEWKQILTAEQYNVMRQKGTEAPYSSPLNDIHEKGTFVCAACELPLFSSATKFDSGTGWPSFWAPIKKENVREQVDNSLSMTRTEVLCARCDAHSGHVFDDGPKPTGLRYCMNGVALKFVKRP
jgi:peptide-methionine (R)-S-oxide reductase